MKTQNELQQLIRSGAFARLSPFARALLTVISITGEQTNDELMRLSGIYNERALELALDDLKGAGLVGDVTSNLESKSSRKIASGSKKIKKLVPKTQG